MAFRGFPWPARAALLVGGISAFITGASACYAATNWIVRLQPNPPHRV